MSGNLLSMNTFQQGEMGGGGSNYMLQYTGVIMPPVTRRRPFWLNTIDPSMLGDTHSAPGCTPYQHNNQQVYVLAG